MKESIMRAWNDCSTYDCSPVVRLNQLLLFDLKGEMTMPNLELSLEDVKHLRNHLTFASRYLEEGIEAETDSEIVKLAEEELEMVGEYIAIFTNFINLLG